jgi:predicted  nucleic acid-binding Zn-ribbon protein
MIEAILKLQKLNIEIDHIRSDAKVYPDQLSEAQKKYDVKKRVFDETKTRIQALKAELSDMKEKLSLEEQRLSKSRKKINELTKSYEYQAMKKEIESTERSNTELTTQIEEKNKEVEKAEGELTGIETEYKAVEDILNSVKSEVAVKVGEFDGVLNIKVEEAKELEAQCDRQLLSKYNLIRTRKYQDAIVAVISGACQGCFMNVPPQMANQMMQRKTTVETCPNCQRLIYWHEQK